jgi:FkbM family methyltransferase
MTTVTLHGITLEIPQAVQTPGLMGRLDRGTYEEDEAHAAKKRIKPGLRVLELGAGLGFVSNICAAQAGAENLLSVEANPAMVPVIRANLDRNGNEKAQLIHGAVTGDEDGGDIAFQANAAFLGGSLARPDVAAEDLVDVPRIGIRTLIARHSPQVVLMDVEGAEAELFDSPWNPQLRFLIVELHPPRYPATVIKRIVDCMSETGLTYDPQTSRGRILGFRRVWPGKDGG